MAVARFFGEYPLFPFPSSLSLGFVAIRSETLRNPAVSGRFYSPRRIVAFLTQGLRRQPCALKHRTRYDILYLSLRPGDECARIAAKESRPCTRLSESAQEFAHARSGFAVTHCAARGNERATSRIIVFIHCHITASYASMRSFSRERATRLSPKKKLAANAK